MRAGEARLPATAARLAIVLAGGLAVVLVYASPGYMTWDSVEQLDQARSGELTNWHPPLMSAIWSVLDRIVSGPLLMLLLQCGLFLIGVFACLSRRLTPRRAVIFAIAIFVFPPSLASMAVIVKDSLMCGLLLAGLAGWTSERPRLRILGLVAFGLAIGLRYNALFAALPLIVLLCPWPTRAARWRRWLVGGTLALGLTTLAWLGNRALTDVPTHPFHASVATMDLVGILTYAPALTDDEVRALFDGVPLVPRDGLQRKARAMYDPNRWWGDYLYGPERLFDVPASAAARDAVASTWRRLIQRYPAAYLRSRADMFRELLGLTDVPWSAVFAAHKEQWMYKGIGRTPPAHGALQRWLSRRMTERGNASLAFRPYPYFLLAIVLLIVLRRDPLMVALLTSALAYTCTLFVITPAPDIRYTHWLMVCVAIGLVVRLFARREGGRGHRGGPPEGISGDRGGAVNSAWPAHPL